MKHFFYTPTVRCSKHGKSAAYEVRDETNERYRYACTEKCARDQVAELEKAWAKRNLSVGAARDD